MEYRRFGPTDLTVSTLGAGVYVYGDGQYDDEMVAAIHRALDEGVTCFDTAPHYGKGDSERLLGRILGPRRKDVVIVTKVGFGFPESTTGRDSSPETIAPLVGQSLQRMQTDYIDVLLVHALDHNTPVADTLGAMDEMVQQGKVRAIGVSNYTFEKIKECEEARPIDVVQYGYNMFDRRVETEVLPYCLERGIGVMTYASMGYGLLSGAVTVDTKFGANDMRGTGGYVGFTAGLLDLEHRQRNLELVEELKPIAARRGKTMPQLALRWNLSHPALSTALVGIIAQRELEENLGSQGWALSSDELDEIDAVFARYGIDNHPDISLDPYVA